LPAIFISYRREDAEDSARALYETLLREFGKERLFMDVEAIALGSDFREAVENSLDNCGVFLAVIGPNWLDAKLPNDPTGRRRLDHPGDYVRQEVGTALKRGSKLPVIPVLVRGANMPTPDELPDELKDLAYRNALLLSHMDWDGNVQKLVDSIRPKLCEPEGTASTAQPASAARASAPTPVPSSARDQSGEVPPGRGISKPVLFGVPALILAAVAGYFVLKPKPTPAPTGKTDVVTSDTKPDTASNNATPPVAASSGTTTTRDIPSTQPTAAAGGEASTPQPASVPQRIDVTILGPDFNAVNFVIDGHNLPLHRNGKAQTIRLTPGEHHFTFPVSGCRGTFTVASGQTRFLPEMHSKTDCKLRSMSDQRGGHQ
jgi:hypothetical protein